MCIPTYLSALGHKHMLMNTQVSPRPSSAPQLFWARPEANKVRDCQLPTGPSHCVTGLGQPAPNPSPG